ncbi:glycosyltransferase 87 family protein [Streptomyces sp. WAC00303]|uniref:glycosyltransferase 87 family protein n=1 Tax=Streptomyces TaxID=1883 RepID=UPI002065C2E8|nr:glycosyltransferase 87 family protein [Streptomyces sp. WAC00303]UPT45000.1 glycosyltransferase 87 family protein [Streptomyces sp. WAC00303]WTF61252.1 glycosyltransferase 87 family protein [Streptomyces anulatus]
MATFALPTPSDLRRDRPVLPGDAAWWAFCAATALALGAFSSLGPHRVWGAAAALGYTAAAVLAGRGRSPRTAGAVAVTGAVLLPLVVLLAVDRAQLEVDVVARSAGLLLSGGTPYLERPTVPEDFNPYLPGMAAFGIPEAVAGPGPLTDPRLWMGAAFLGAFALALPAGARREAPRWLAACPLVALPLAVGGVDLPVAGLMCLGLARAGQGRAGRAGLSLGVAAALKWTAWPAVPVALALLATTGGGDGRRGSRAALRCGLVALFTVAAIVLPAALRDPGAFRTHVVDFPLGFTGAVSSAASPLPGHLLATQLPGGRTPALLLLGVSALLLAVSLLVRPPATAAAAAARLALGLLLAIAFMPATRFGYLVHPLVLGAWALARQPPAHPLRIRERVRDLLREPVRRRKQASR